MRSTDLRSVFTSWSTATAAEQLVPLGTRCRLYSVLCVMKAGGSGGVNLVNFFDGSLIASNIIYQLLVGEEAFHALNDYIQNIPEQGILFTDGIAAQRNTGIGISSMTITVQNL